MLQIRLLFPCSLSWLCNIFQHISICGPNKACHLWPKATSNLNIKAEVMVVVQSLSRVRLLRPRGPQHARPLHQLPEFTQTHAHRVGDAIQPPHPHEKPVNTGGVTYAKKRHAFPTEYRQRRPHSLRRRRAEAQRGPRAEDPGRAGSRPEPSRRLTLRGDPSQVGRILRAPQQPEMSSESAGRAEITQRWSIRSVSKQLQVD